MRHPFLHRDLLARAAYSEGAGIARTLPCAIAVPASAGDVATLVRWATETNTPLVPRGSGSGMAGGAVGDGVIVDLSRLRDIGPVDAARRTVKVGPGAIRDAVNEAARPFGLHLPVDPSSGAFCTVGGMASTNAAGAHTLRYGSMRRWVTALDCVFEDGSRAVVRRGDPPPIHVPAVARFLGLARESLAAWSASAAAHAGVRKESSGYALAEFARGGELVDLLVGSEGTLALFVGVELAVAPLPGATSSLLAEFRSLEGAVTGAAQARLAGASACELLDRTFLEIAAQGGESTIGAGVEAVLLVEVEGVDSADAQAQTRALQAAFAQAGASAVRLAADADTQRALWEFRHAASPILARLDPALKSMQFIEDGAVPVERLHDYVHGVRQALESAGVRGVIFGHAGDAHVHVNPLIDVRLSDWRARAGQLLGDVVSLTASLGGTLSGEHGDGRLRTPLLSRVWPGESVEQFALVKRAFDPRGLLNPGVKVPLRDQQALGPIKYDPMLEPLPDAARAALDRIERERLYAAPRLDLVASVAHEAGESRLGG